MKNNTCTNCSYGDCVATLLSSYESISERIKELRESSEQSKCRIYDEKYFIQYSDLFNSAYDDTKKLFIAEEDFLFPELKSLLPDSSSVRAIKAEQDEILDLFDFIHNLLTDCASLNKNRDLVELSIIKLDNLLERIIHKKNIMLHHEALVLLDPQTLVEIGENLQKVVMYKKEPDSCRKATI